MNILWLSHMVPYPPKGGSLQRSFNLIRKLSGLHTVHLLAFNQRALLHTAEQVEESRLALSRHCCRVEILEAPAERSSVLRHWRLLANLAKASPYSVDLLTTPAMHAAVARLCDEVQIDLVHCDSSELVQFVPASFKGHSVLNHHNVESLLLRRRSQRGANWAARMYLRLQADKLAAYERVHLGRFDLNLAVSEGDREELLTLSPSANVVVVPNGVDLDYFQPTATSPEKAELMFMGGMTWFPNRDAVSYFISAIWPLVKAQRPDAHLTLIGRRPELIRAMTRDPRIAILGFVDDIRPNLERSEVIIIPIRVGGGTRLKILDAFASGKAVVSTKIGCEGIDVSHGRDILIADTPDEFANAVTRVCGDANLRDTLGRNARRLVEEKYSWDYIGGALARQYEHLVDQGEA